MICLFTSLALMGVYRIRLFGEEKNHTPRMTVGLVNHQLKQQVRTTLSKPSLPNRFWGQMKQDSDIV